MDTENHVRDLRLPKRAVKTSWEDIGDRDSEGGGCCGGVIEREIPITSAGVAPEREIHSVEHEYLR